MKRLQTIRTFLPAQSRNSQTSPHNSCSKSLLLLKVHQLIQYNKLYLTYNVHQTYSSFLYLPFTHHSTVGHHLFWPQVLSSLTFCTCYYTAVYSISLCSTSSLAANSQKTSVNLLILDPIAVLVFLDLPTDQLKLNNYRPTDGRESPVLVQRNNVGWLRRSNQHGSQGRHDSES